MFSAGSDVLSFSPMRNPFRALAGAAVFSAAVLSSAAIAAEGAWRSLWNGKDLSGWDTYLAKPHVSVRYDGEQRNEKGEHVGPVGLNRDPKKVFSVVRQDGQAAIRSSGEIFGTITTKETFSNYHLRVEMKWGEKKWPPRTELKRDSGLLYHAHGPWGTVGPWLPSLELQIQETDIGDFWSVNSRAMVRARPLQAKDFIYDPKGEPKLFAMTMPGVPRRCIKGADHEKPHGQWNVIEIVCLGDKAWHMVNGQVVMALEKCERKDGDTWGPATSGHIQLQSEGAEVFFRKVELRNITELPAHFAKAAAKR